MTCFNCDYDICNRCSDPNRDSQNQADYWFPIYLYYRCALANENHPLLSINSVSFGESTTSGGGGGANGWMTQKLGGGASRGSRGGSISGAIKDISAPIRQSRSNSNAGHTSAAASAVAEAAANPATTTRFWLQTGPVNPFSPMHDAVSIKKVTYKNWRLVF